VRINASPGCAACYQAPTLIGCLVFKEQICVKQRNEIMKKFFNLVKQLGWVTQPVINLPHRGKTA
jgi:hypothetical protein